MATINGTDGADTLLGTSDADLILGLGGNDTIDGGGGTDTLRGGQGDDTYIVNIARDIAANPAQGRQTVNTDERANEGNDTVLVIAGGTNPTYRLISGSSIEILAASDINSTLALNLFGNEMSQRITGNNGNNTLVGGGSSPGAADTLIGLGGDDIFQVRALGDMVIETAHGGNDIVYATVSYNLGDNEVEALSTVDNAASDPINLIGNYVSQTIVGNYGDNLLNGGSGVDTLIGLYGNDLYAVGDSRIVIVEGEGQGGDTVVTSVNYALGAGVSAEVLSAQDRGSSVGLVLSGNSFGQTIAGTAGADTINGGGGNDVLLGGAGADRFDFSTALGANNVDGIADFDAADRIGLASNVFAGVGSSLAAGAFVMGTAALDGDDRIIYDANSGRIFYDADGTGAGAAMLFALVLPGSAVSAATFEVIAPVGTL